MLKSIFSVLLAGLAATAMAGVQCKNCGVATDNVIYRCRDGHIVCSKCMDDVHPVLGSGGTFGMLAFGSSAKMIGLCSHVNASDEKCGSPIFANSKIVADNRDPDDVAENRRRRVRSAPDDAELEYLLAENHYTAGRLEEAISIFVKLVDSTSNGIVLNSIRKKYEELVEHEPDNEEYQKLLVNCLRQCGDPNAMQYVDDDEEEYNYEKEQEEIENGDENESEGEEDTSLSEQELQYADDYEMNAIQQCRLKLLNEVDEICRENEIPYYLAGKILQQAVQYHRYIDPNGEITVAMTADNFRKFNKVIEKKHLKNRAVESLENNPNFFRVVASYVDTDTMDIPLIRFDTVNYPGIHIVIEILRSKEMSKLTEMKNRMLEKGWECRTIQRNQKLSTKVSMKVIDAACSVRGTEKVSKDIFKILTKDHFSISDKMYYIRRFNKSRKYYPAELFADTTEVLLEGKKYPTVSHYNEYLELMFGFDWREKDYPLTNHNKYTRIIDPNLTAAEYKEYLAEHDIDPVQFQKSWKEIDMKYRPIKRKTKRIAKYWHILYACGERDRLYDLYHPQKDEILQLYEAGNYDALMERMSEHIEVARKLARKGVGFSFDSELFDVMIDCLRHEGRDEEADRFITLNEKREWTDIVKE